MNITILTNRDLASHIALGRLVKLLDNHSLTIFMSEKVGKDHSLPDPIMALGAFEKDLITLKHSILKKDLTKLKELQLSNYFNETSAIYYLNSNLSKIKKDDLNTITINNFFSNAVSLYLNDI